MKSIPEEQEREAFDPVPFSAGCTVALRNTGKPYPRTCKACGLGPCKFFKEEKRASLAERQDSQALPDVGTGRGGRSMTVAELIEELRKQPQHKPAKVVVRSVFIADEAGESMVPLCEYDADEADEVRNEGAFVLIWGGRA